MQNTSSGCYVPGKDGRRAEKVWRRPLERHRNPSPEADEFAPRPTPGRRILRQSRGVTAVWRWVAFHGGRPRLLAAVVAVVARRRRPEGQHGEGLLALRASAAPHPDPIVPLVMSLLAPASMPDDRILAADRASARQLRQADLSYPGSALSSAHGSAIKRITAGVKARRWSHRQVRSGDWPSPSCMDSVERKKNERILARS